MIYKKTFSEKDIEIGKLWIKNNCKEEKIKVIQDKIIDTEINVNNNLYNSFDNLENYGDNGKRKWPEEMKTLGGKDRLVELVRIRDNHTCQKCGKVWKEGTRRLDVHHTDEEIEGKLGLKYCNCKDMTKMITLCHKCHLNLPVVKKKMIKSYKNH